MIKKVLIFTLLLLNIPAYADQKSSGIPNSAADKLAEGYLSDPKTPNQVAMKHLITQIIKAILSNNENILSEKTALTNKLKGTLVTASQIQVAQSSEDIDSALSNKDCDSCGLLRTLDILYIHDALEYGKLSDIYDRLNSQCAIMSSRL